MLAPLDYAVIAFYFVFMAGIGWYFRRGNVDSSDFFRGGGRMPWWLVGVSAFMSSFSAWTFTAAAGLAYEGGLVVLTIYWGNALAYMVAALFFARRFRQTRAITPIDAIRQRLGATNAQLIVWLRIPLGILVAAVWLYGLAIFLAPVFRLDVTTIIAGCGVLVIIVAALGGSWAEITGDFVQALLLMPLTLVAAWLALERVGGLQPLWDGLPNAHFDLTARSMPGFGALWLTALSIQKLVVMNGLDSAGRYLCVRNGLEARRAAIFTAVLFILGSLIWFIPPLAARSLGVDLAAQFPHLAQPGEAAYAAMAIMTLPSGLLGLLVIALIAATVSSMDSGLNGNAGNFVRGVYRPLLRPLASEREQVLAGRITTVIMGVMIILLALKYTTWKDTGVLKLMFNISAMVGMPTAVPLFWCVLTRRNPDWAAWSSALVGFSLSTIIGGLPRVSWFADRVALAGWTVELEWIRTNEFGVVALSNFIICSLWFWGTTLVRSAPLPQRKYEVEAFFSAMHRPLDSAETPSGPSQAKVRAISRMCLAYGVFLLVIAIIPNSAEGHIGLSVCAGFFFIVTGLLLVCGRRAEPVVVSKPDVITRPTEPALRTDDAPACR